MSKLFSITSPDLQAAIKKLGATSKELPIAVTRALRGWGEETRTVALRRTPKRWGTLRDTLTVKVNGTDSCKVEIYAGGPAAPYAVVQHEKQFDNYTTAGTGPKYLENPINERLPRLQADVKRELDGLIK